MSLQILENESLAPYTLYKIGGPARFFARVGSREDLDQAIIFAKEHSLPITVLGGGSNVLVSDAGCDGLVLKMEDRTIRIDGTLCYAGAGAIYAAVAKGTADVGLAGLEWAYGIPGTIGGAIRGNAGAFGYSTSERIFNVDLFDVEHQSYFRATPDDLQCSYRRSILSSRPWIVIAATFSLHPSSIDECQERLQSFLEQKKAGQPLGVQCAGCTFKNVLVEHIPHSFECPIEFLQKGIISAGFLLDKANMKNHVIGRAMVSSKHANFIVNLGGATSGDIAELIRVGKEQVFERFGIQLEEEIQYIGTFPCLNR